MLDIQPVLRRFPPDCQPSRLEFLSSAGGLSGAQFWRIVAPRGTLVLRCWPIEHPTPNGLQFIHAVLQHAQRRGMTILPVPMATMSSDTIVHHAGRLWELTPWLPGAADYERSPSVERLRAAMIALARFHVATSDFSPPLQGEVRGGFAAPASSITRRLARFRELETGGINTLSRAITDSTWPDLTPLARQFVAALPDAVPQDIARLAPLADVALPLQPCIRDIWHDHVLFEEDRVTGLIDFGALAIDTPATDIARLVGSLSDLPPPPLLWKGLGEEYVTSRDAWPLARAVYSTIRPLTAQEIAAAHALDAAGTILAGCNWIQWIYVEGRKFESPPQIIDRFRRLLNRLRSPHIN